MEDDEILLAPLTKVAISGPTLASLLHRISTSHSDINGLLFGHVTHLTSTSLSDDHPTTTSTTTSTATISSFLSTTAASNHPNLTLLGTFSGRRKSPLRPSLKEFSLAHSIHSDKNSSIKSEPFLFLLFTTPIENQFVHTHDYRAYQFLKKRNSLTSLEKRSDFYFDPISIDVVNIGPAFRGGYGDFVPNSMFPCLDCETMVLPMVEDDREERSLIELKREKEDQGKLSGLCAEGFGIVDLGRLVGSEAVNYTRSLEGLYEKMIAKLEDLTRKVEASSAKVLEQETHNIKLRYKVAGLD